MGNLAKREKIMLAVLGLVIVAYLYYTFLLNPYLMKMETSRENIKKYTVEVTKIRSAKSEIEKKKVELEGLKVKLADALKGLPEGERNPELIRRIKELADTNLVTLTPLSFGPPTDYALPATQEKAKEGADNKSGEENKDNTQNQTEQNTAKQPEKSGLHMVPVNIAAEGKYGDIMNFINTLETDKRIALITAVTLSDAQETGKVTANLQTVFYYADNFTGEKLDYGFNTGQYGKTDLFK